MSYKSFIKKIKYNKQKKSFLKKINDLNLNNEIKISEYNPNLSIHIDGINNQINLTKLNPESKIKIIVYGDNNKIEIDSNWFLNIELLVGLSNSKEDKAHNTKFILKDRTYINQASIIIGEDNSEIIIGEDCAVATGVNIWCTDRHAIYDKSGNLLNEGKFVHIGNHVWIGQNVFIGKNTKIADNSIVGYGSVVVSKIFDMGGGGLQVIQQR